MVADGRDFPGKPRPLEQKMLSTGRGGLWASEVLRPSEVLKLPEVLISYAAMGTGWTDAAEEIHNQYIHISE